MSDIDPAEWRPITAPVKVVPNLRCVKCQSEVHEQVGPFGRFFRCSAYPTCDIQYPVLNGRFPGSPSDATTRQWRGRAHAVFDVLWRSGQMTRQRSYAWLATQMGLPGAQAHIRFFSVSQCRWIIALVTLGVNLPTAQDVPTAAPIPGADRGQAE